MPGYLQHGARGFYTGLHVPDMQFYKLFQLNGHPVTDGTVLPYGLTSGITPLVL